MQSHDNDQCTAQSDFDGRRNAEQSAAQSSDRVECTQVPDVANRTVCLSAGLTGKGGAAG